MSDMVAVFAENGLFYKGLTTLQKGYNIIRSDEAETWMNITNKVRLATPQEVAQAYGV